MIRLVLMLLLSSTPAMAAPLHPYALASDAAGDHGAKVSQTKAALTGAGFRVLGQVSPRSGATVVVITHPKLLSIASGTAFGGFGAALRVSITTDEGREEVAYTDPRWMANVYRMKGTNDDLYELLKATLGGATPFGSKKGIEPSNLRGYHYMMMMPYFDSRDELATHASHEAAVAAVRAGLAAKVGGARRVFELNVPGGSTLFGVAMTQGGGADSVVLGKCDSGALKHSAYAPYEILVVGNTAYALPGKFRIAQSFPDLSMGTFMRISDAPGAIRKTLAAVAKGP